MITNRGKCTGSSYTDKGATANDTLDGNLTANMVTTGTVDTTTPGTYTLTYTVSDPAVATERPPSKERVTVEDTTAPGDYPGRQCHS